MKAKQLIKPMEPIYCHRTLLNVMLAGILALLLSFFLRNMAL
jgi:hypothetical protein